MIIGFSRAAAAGPSVVPPSLSWQWPLSVAPDLPMKRMMPRLTDRGDAGWVAAADVAGCPTSAAFLARTSGLNATHIDAYNELICGLVSDGVWTKLDVLHVFATQDSTTAMLNLVSASYTGLPTVPQMVFTVDRGVNWVGGQIGGGNVNSQFNPTTAPSPKFTRNDGHVSSWGLTDTQDTAEIMGAGVAAGWFTGILTRYTDDKPYYYVNQSTNVVGFSTVATSIGHYIGSRNSSTQIIGYKDGAVHGTDNANNSVAPASLDIYTASFNFNGTPVVTSNQIAASSIGSALTPTDVTNFYTRLRTYMTAVGVP